MIDEKVLIERLKKYQIEYKSGFGSLTDETVFRVMENVIYIVKDLAKEHNNGWISVEDELPKESMPVLVTTGTEMIWTAFYDRTHGTWVDDVRGKVLNVIAWMELPAPYKKGE